MTQWLRRAVTGLVSLTIISGYSPAHTAASANSADSAAPAVSGPARAADQAPTSGAGAAGVGDVYYPMYGNGGYQVVHYAIHVAYDPATHQLLGDTTISARTTQRLTSFHLDLLLTATRVWVNGEPARFAHRARHELVVVPTQPLASRSAMVVRVQYAGQPEQISVPSRIGGRTHPWLRAGSETFVNGQPEGAALWFPVNDHPIDKASYDITARVARSWQAVANGSMVSHRASGTDSVWHWRQPTPMVSNLAFLGLGHFQIRQGTVGDLPYTYAWSDRLSPQDTAAVRRSLLTTPARVAWLAGHLTPYPFQHIGGVVPSMNVSTIESQTDPVYNHFAVDDRSSADIEMPHELAHQWFGDSVALRQYRDMWLNEGFAVWTQWWYAARHGGPGLNQQLRTQYRLHPADDPFWHHETADPERNTLFGPADYVRGAMTAQALSNVIGASTFHRLLRHWLTLHRYGQGTTSGFEHLAAAISGQNLHHFFLVWLHTAARPGQTTASGLAPPMR